MTQTVGLGVEIADRTQTGARRVIRSFRNIQKEARKTARESEKLDKQFTDLQNEMFGKIGRYATLAGGFALVSGAIIKASKSAAEFQTAMAEVSTLLPKSSKELAVLNAGVLEMSQRFGAMPVDTAKATYQIISAGAADAAAAMNLLEASNKLAIGGVTDVLTAADGLTSVLNAYGMEAKDAASISDTMFVAMRAGKTTIGELSASLGQIAPIAAQTGVSFEQVLSAVAALTKGGVSTNVSITGLRQILASMLKPTKEASDLAQQLGLNFNATALKSMGLQGALQEITEKTGGSQEQLALLFGGVEALTPAMALTGKAAIDFNGILEDMGDKAGATDEAFEKMEKTLNVRMDRLKAKIEVALIETGNELVPTWENATEKMANALSDPEVTEGLKAISGAIADVVTGLLQLSTWAANNPKLFATLAGAGAGAKVGGGVGALVGGIGGLAFGATDLSLSYGGWGGNSRTSLERDNGYDTSAGVFGTVDGGGSQLTGQTMLEYLTERGDVEQFRTESLLESTENLQESVEALTQTTTDIGLGKFVKEKADESRRRTEYRNQYKDQIAVRMYPEIEMPFFDKTFDVDESVFGFDEVIEEVDAAFAFLNNTLDVTLRSLSIISPEFSALAKDLVEMARGNYMPIIGTTLDGLIGGFKALSDAPPAIGELTSAIAQLNDVARRTAQSSLGVYETLFAEENQQFQERMSNTFEFLFNRTFDFDPSAGLLESAEEIQNFISLMSRFDTLMTEAITKENIGSVAGALSEAQSYFNLGGRGQVGQGDIANLNNRSLTSTGRAILQDFTEQVGYFRQVFGDFTFTELGEEMFRTSDSFTELREASNSFREANERSIDSIERLTAAEEAATRLRVNAEEIALRTQLSQQFRRAGGDIFEQRAAFARFEEAVRQLRYTGSTGGGGGAAATATAAATTPADNAATESGAEETTISAATQSGTVTYEATITPDLQFEIVSIEPEQLIDLPTVAEFQSYYEEMLAPVLTGGGKLGGVLNQHILNTQNERDLRQYTGYDFLSMPTEKSFARVYESDLLPVMSGGGELGHVLNQHIGNTHNERDQRQYTGFDFLSMPTEESFATVYERDLLPVMSGGGKLSDTLNQHISNTHDERDEREYTGFDFISMPTEESFATVYERDLLPVMSGGGKLSDALNQHISSTHNERDQRQYTGFDFLSMPTAASFATVYERDLLPAMSGRGALGGKLDQHMRNTRRERNMRQYTGFDFIRMPTASSFATVYERDLLPNMSGNGELGRKLDQHISNTRRERDARQYSASDFLKMPDSFSFKEFYSTELLPILNGDGNINRVLDQHMQNTRDIRDQKVYAASDFIALPDTFDFFFLFGDLVPSITDALQAVFSNLPKVNINLIDLIDIDATDIQDAITERIKDSIDDRAYDYNTTISGYGEGRV